MARTIAEIYNNMIVEKETFSNLSELSPVSDTFSTLLRDLNTTSRVAIWRMLFAVVAVAIHLQEVYYDLFLAELEAIKSTLPTGTDEWYEQRAKEFQLGDSLVWNNNQFVYAVSDTTKQIITYASSISQGSLLFVKAAKDNAGSPEKLSAGELSAFTAYINDISFVGTEIQVISTDGDLLNLTASVFVNPLLINLDGTSVETGDPVISTAITAYLANLNFAGVFRIIDLVDAIQSVGGVTNVVITSCEAKADFALSFENVLSTSTQTYTAYAGYMVQNTINITYST